MRKGLGLSRPVPRGQASARDRSSPAARYREAGRRNPPPRVILPPTGFTSGRRNPPPNVILLVAGRRNPPPRQMGPRYVVEVLMENSNPGKIAGDYPIAGRSATPANQTPASHPGEPAARIAAPFRPK